MNEYHRNKLLAFILHLFTKIDDMKEYFLIKHYYMETAVIQHVAGIDVSKDSLEVALIKCANGKSVVKGSRCFANVYKGHQSLLK